VHELKSVVVDGDLAYIPLSQGYTAAIDAADVDRISGRNWHAHVRRRKDGSIYTIYAITNIQHTDGTRTATNLHRLLLDAPAHLQVDHINGDGLLNTRANLRLCSATENQRNQRTDRRSNRSGIKGVYLQEHPRRWMAHIRIDGKLMYLGRFDEPGKAAAAYDAAAKQHYGEFAKTNDLRGDIPNV
jgi:hypothetical protein